MDKNLYFKILEDTSKEILPIIRSKCNEIFSVQEFKDGALKFIEKRVNDKAKFQKPFLLRLCYEVAGGIDWHRVAEIGAAIELINISTYLANCSIDGKFGTISSLEKGNHFIFSMISREYATESIFRNTEENKRDKIIKTFHELATSNKNIYIGQYLDLNVLNLKNFDCTTEMENFLSLYTKRCYGLSGAFNERIAFIGGLLADADYNELQALRVFGRNFGIALQIVNDIGDLVPSGIDPLISKEYQDQFSDLKNERLTLPIFYLLKTGNEFEKQKVFDTVKKRGSTVRELTEISKIFTTCGAISFSKAYANKFVKKARSALKTFKPCPQRSMMSMLLSIVNTNKYFFALRRISQMNLWTLLINIK